MIKTHYNFWDDDCTKINPSKETAIVTCFVSDKDLELKKGQDMRLGFLVGSCVSITRKKSNDTHGVKIKMMVKYNILNEIEVDEDGV